MIIAFYSTFSEMGYFFHKREAEILMNPAFSTYIGKRWVSLFKLGSTSAGDQRHTETEDHHQQLKTEQDGADIGRGLPGRAS